MSEIYSDVSFFIPHNFVFPSSVLSAIDFIDFINLFNFLNFLFFPFNFHSYFIISPTYFVFSLLFFFSLEIGTQITDLYIFLSFLI